MSYIQEHSQLRRQQTYDKFAPSLVVLLTLLPVLPAVRTAGISNPDPKDVDLPVKGFGAWTFPQTQNGCQYSFATDSTSDAWPFGLCSLKKVGNPASPTFHQRPAGECCGSLIAA